ncbi:MAG TPA: HDOD domain-containing protein [Rhodocyclaceae bacterium]|nr:HDOD domain-containing protein [Zoogloeaceae bacterium]HRD35700.1 HDOD domain-containing protein [Rhodocyclaceae bacterium]
MHSAQELVAHIEGLASLPTVYLRIREELDSENCSLAEVARIIAADPALSARVLHVVNSALYGYGGRIDTIQRAVTILGLQQVHDLVLAMSIGSVFQNVKPEHMNMKRFWQGSVMCGLAAREIGQRIKQANPERLLTIGLLSDLGHLVMYQTVPHLAEEAQVHADASATPLYQAERKIVGCDYAEVGATLAQQWKLPVCFAQAIGAQVNPRLGGEFITEASVLNIAAQIIAADRSGEASDAAAGRIDPLVWAQVGLAPADFGALRETAELQLASYIAVLFPATPLR